MSKRGKKIISALPKANFYFFLATKWEKGHSAALRFTQQDDTVIEDHLQKYAVLTYLSFGITQ